MQVPWFGFGAGCGVGVGFGWGFFLAGTGAPVWQVSEMLRLNERAMDAAYEKAMKERELGLRPPIGTRRTAGGEEPPDTVLDRVLRMIRERSRRRGLGGL